MDQGLKERLIGAAVLVALGVWLIPWLLDGRQEQVELASPARRCACRRPTVRCRFASKRSSLQAARKSDTATTELYPNSPIPTPAAAAAAGPAVASAEPTPPPTQENAAPPKPSAPAQESAAPPKQIAPAPVKPGTDRNSQGLRRSAAPVATPKPSPKPGASAAPAHGDWAVQLGSFGAEDTKKLADKAKVYGYKAEVGAFRASGRAMYRVRLGPYASRAEADATASALSAHGFAPQVVAADRRHRMTPVDYLIVLVLVVSVAGGWRRLRQGSAFVAHAARCAIWLAWRFAALVEPKLSNWAADQEAPDLDRARGHLRARARCGGARVLGRPPAHSARAHRSRPHARRCVRLRARRPHPGCRALGALPWISSIWTKMGGGNRHGSGRRRASRGGCEEVRGARHSLRPRRSGGVTRFALGVSRSSLL